MNKVLNILLLTLGISSYSKEQVTLRSGTKVELEPLENLEHLQKPQSLSLFDYVDRHDNQVKSSSMESFFRLSNRENETHELTIYLAAMLGGWDTLKINNEPVKSYELIRRCLDSGKQLDLSIIESAIRQMSVRIIKDGIQNRLIDLKDKEHILRRIAHWRSENTYRTAYDKNYVNKIYDQMEGWVMHYSGEKAESDSLESSLITVAANSQAASSSTDHKYRDEEFPHYRSADQEDAESSTLGSSLVAVAANSQAASSSTDRSDREKVIFPYMPAEQKIVDSSIVWISLDINGNLAASASYLNRLRNNGKPFYIFTPH